MPKQDADTDEVNERGKTDERVLNFVFTATTSSSNDPSSPDYVKSKRRPATGAVSFNLTPEEIGRKERDGERERSRDEMAILAEQLELGGSDNVSLSHLHVHTVYIYMREYCTQYSPATILLL